MPDNCINRVVAPQKVLEELYDGYKITFQKLVPMPKEIEDTECSTAIEINRYIYDYFHGKPANLVREWEREYNKRKYSNIEKYVENLLKKHPMGEVNKQHELIEKYGADNWYDWSCTNWGTKWDAYDGSGKPKDGELVFVTAWCPPINIVKVLFEKYPNIKIEWNYEESEESGKYYSNGKGEFFKALKKEIYVEDEEEEE